MTTGTPASRVQMVRGRPCPYCGIKMRGVFPALDSPTRDHVNPRALGGGPIIMCCRRCNLDKNNLTLPEWGDVLVGRRDYRWKLVAALNMEVKTGRLQFVPFLVSATGLAPGIFS